MRKRIALIALTLCLCISFQSVTYASWEIPLQQEDVLTEEPANEPGFGDNAFTASREDFSQQEDVRAEESADEPGISDNALGASQEELPRQEDVLMEEPADGPDTGGDILTVPQEEFSRQEDIPVDKSTDGLAPRDSVVLTPTEVYGAMIALRDQDGYKEGTTWTNDEPYSYSKGYYHWNGGTLEGKNISAAGCVAFAFVLSDAAFGSLPARIYAEGKFAFESIKNGDILRMNNDTHTVIVLEVSDAGVVIAEGNNGGKVHWERAISKEIVMRDTSHYITRYPEGYVPPDDPEANEPIADGSLEGGLVWNLTKEGILTISGQGAMPDFGSTGDQPWSDNGSQIRKVVIGDGVTSIGSCAFGNCGVLAAEISSSVTTIGNSAFRGSSIISVAIPSSVKTIGDSAFRECQNLSSVVLSEGLETIASNAFRACTSLTSIALPASIEEVGTAAFFECTAMKGVFFAQDSKQVKLGDNMFTQCYELMSVTLPQNIDCIGEGMFQNCLMLAGVEIPQGAASIGASAFASCSSMTTVIIPDSVTTIGIAAFSACPLTDIYFAGTEAQWNSIRKIGDTASAVSKATIHYNYTPEAKPDDGGNSDNDDSDKPGNNESDKPGNDEDDKLGNTEGGNSNNIEDENPSNTEDNKPGNIEGDNLGNTGDDNPGSTEGDDSGNTPDDDSDNKPGGDKPGNTSSGNKQDSSLSDKVRNNAITNGSNDSNNGKAESDLMVSSVIDSGVKASVANWEPITLDEIKRYACMGKETVQYTLSKDNVCQISIENAMQGPMCFQSFETVLGDYTIGRTYNIHALSDTTYSMEKEIQLTIKIPSTIYKKDREYKMICVTKGGQPILYNDLDSDPRTITVKTNKFYAYALIYK